MPRLARHSIARRSLARPSVWLVIFSFFGLANTASAEDLLPSSGEFRANATTSSLQGYPDAASSTDGEFLVVWESLSQDGNGWGIFTRVFDGAGQSQGADILVNTQTLDSQIFPAVAGDGQGNFVVVWASYGQDAPGNYGVFGQQLDATGTKVGTEFQANSFTPGYQGNADVALADDGSFLVVWESAGQDGSGGGIYGQLFDADGNEVGIELTLNDTTNGEQNDPKAAYTGGGFAVVWESDNFDGIDEGVVLQLLDTSAGFVGGEVQVNSHTFGDQEDPDIAVNDDGSFVVVWEGAAQDGDGEGVFGQLFGSDGIAVGDELQLNTHTTGDQKNPTVAALGDGTFVAAWESVDQTPSSGDDLYGQRFDSAGQFLGDEFRLNSTLSDDQDKVAMAGSDGRLLTAWRAFDAAGADVRGQGYEVALFADGFESGDVSAWSSVFP